MGVDDTAVVDGVPKAPHHRAKGDRRSALGGRAAAPAAAAADGRGRRNDCPGRQRDQRGAEPQPVHLLDPIAPISEGMRE